jgi:hypothetical protein
MEVVYNRDQCSDGVNVKALDEIVSSVVSASGLPTASRRRELERELRGHLEDVTDELRLSGCPDDGIEEAVRARFGDSRAVARSFAETYKVERVLMQATMCFALFLVCAAAVAVIVSSGQASAALAIGLSQKRAFSRMPWELCGVAALTLGYLGMYVLQVRFRQWKVVTSLGFAFLGLSFLCFAINLLPPAHKIGPGVAFLCAVCARLLERVKPRWVWRLGAAAPLLVAWTIWGPLTGNGRLGPWQMLTLVCFNLTVACQALGWLVHHFEHSTRLQTPDAERLEV